jgi:hypothetical protein
MSQGRYSTLGWILSSLLFALASVVCVLQWRAERSTLQATLAQLTSGLCQVNRKLELANLYWTSLGESFERSQGEFLQLLPKLAQPSTQLQLNVGPLSVKGEQAAPGAAGSESTESSEENLPALPEDVRAEQVVKLDLDALLRDTRFNPGGKEVDRVGAAKFRCLLAQARGTIDLLDSEVKLAIAEGVERLRAEGKFIEYAAGDSYETIEGVLTVGEETESGGVPMFYLYSQEFSNVYEKRGEKARVAERCVRKLIATLGQ